MPKKSFFRALILHLTTLLLVVAMAFPSFSWLAKTLTADFGNKEIHGSTEAAYFASGDGSATNPYVISAPVHLYNLAWLQYIGYFNLNTELNNGRAQSYFKVTANLNMSGLVLPPIGTQQYPFLGNFNGGNFKISNLHTSNTKTESEQLAFFEQYPELADFNDKGLLAAYKTATTTETGNIIGFFGVIGDYNNEVARIGGLSIGDTNVTVSKDAVPTGGNNSATTLYTQAIQAYSFTLNTYTVDCGSQTTTMGFVAGYVNATLSGISVNDCTLKTAANSKGAEFNAYQLSAHALVGYSTNAVTGSHGTVTVYDPQTNTESGLKPDGSGDGEGWGGSIDMSSLVQRLTYMLAENEFRSPSYSGTLTGRPDRPSNSGLVPYPVNFADDTYNETAAAVVIDYNATNTRVAWLGNNTVIPLNVDTATMFGKDDVECTVTKSTTDTGRFYSTTYRTTDYYSKYSKEKVLSTNTGYIVGYSTDTSRSASVRARIEPIKGIAASITADSNVEDEDKRVEYNEATGHNMTFYTVDTTGKNAPINANSNNFQKYTGVTNSFARLLAGKAMISGLRFYSNHLITASDTVSGSVSLNGSMTASSYQLLKGGVNFTLAKSGRVTVIAGTYANASETYVHTLFSIYQVERNDDGTIKSATEITDIYLQGGNVIYNAEPQGELCTHVFSSGNMNKLEKKHAAYYFEIPLDAGDYAIGPASSSTNDGAYLMYLDIGANAATDDDGTFTRTTVAEVYDESTYVTSYVAGVGLGGNEIFSVGVPTGNTSVSFNRADNSNTVTVTGGSNVVLNAAGGDLKVSGASPPTPDKVTVWRLTVTDTQNGGDSPTTTKAVITITQTFTQEGESTFTPTVTTDPQTTVNVTGISLSGNTLTFTYTLSDTTVTAEITKSEDAVFAYTYMGTTNKLTYKNEIYEVTIEGSSCNVTTLNTTNSTTVSKVEINGKTVTEKGEVEITTTT